MVGTAAVGAGLGVYQTIQGAKQAKEARQALENYDRQELSNVAEGLQVSTKGSDLQREEQARLSSSQIEATKQAGTRAIVGATGRIEAGNQKLNREIASDLDRQQKEIDQMKAQDNVRIQGMQEQREVNDINALSSQYNTGQQNMYSGMGTAITGTGQAVLGAKNAIRENKGLATVDAYGNPIQTPVQQQIQTQNRVTAPIYGTRQDTNFDYNPNN